MFRLLYWSLVKFGDFLIAIGVGLSNFITSKLKKPKQKKIRVINGNQIVVIPKSVKDAKTKTLETKKKRVTNLEILTALKQFYEDVNRFQNNRKEASVSSTLTNVLLILIVILVGLNLFSQLFDRQINQSSASSLETQTKVQNLTDLEELTGRRVISSFNNNDLLFEFGSSLEISREEIKVEKHSNCQTPVPPPDINGCSFVLARSNLNLPQNGIFFTNFSIIGSLQGEAEVMVAIKNYEKLDEIEPMGRINKVNLNSSLSLPSQINPTEGLQLTLWEKDGAITINKIVIDYFDVRNLKKVSGRVNNLDLEEPILAGIYWDVNKNGLFDPQTDQPWTCRAGFVGVRPVLINPDGSFALQRDQDCYTAFVPDIWYTDEETLALPAGDWLLIMDSGKTVLPFSISQDKDELILDLNTEVL